MLRLLTYQKLSTNAKRGLPARDNTSDSATTRLTSQLVWFGLTVKNTQPRITSPTLVPRLLRQEPLDNIPKLTIK